MEHGDHLGGRRKRGLPSKAKAQEIMRHGEVKGHPLTMPQSGMMGLMAGGGTPTRTKEQKAKRRKRRGRS